MQLFWTPEAIQDREEIYNYIEANNPLVAMPCCLIFNVALMSLIMFKTVFRAVPETHF